MERRSKSRILSVPQSAPKRFVVLSWLLFWSACAGLLVAVIGFPDSPWRFLSLGFFFAVLVLMGMTAWNNRRRNREYLHGELDEISKKELKAFIDDNNKWAGKVQKREGVESLDHLQRRKAFALERALVKEARQKGVGDFADRAKVVGIMDS